jgi:hypothetical protein
MQSAQKLAFAQPTPLNERLALKRRNELLMPVLSFMTFAPTQNFLTNLGPQQRQFFFESLMQLLHCQNVVEKKREEKILQQRLHLTRSAMEERMHKSTKRDLRKEEEMKKSMQMAQKRLAFEIDEYARGDPAKAKSAIAAYQSELESQGFRQQDLVVPLLIIVEDLIESGATTAGSAGGAGGALRAPSAKEEVKPEIRLGSTREMLRYYFISHPDEFEPALAVALGLTEEEMADIQVLQERLAERVAIEGRHAIAKKIVAEIRRRKKLDEKKCAIELGSYYDKKSGKIVIGKRTCGGFARVLRIFGSMVKIKKN